MAYYISVFDWSLYTLPSAIPMTDIEGDTHSNDPAGPGYSASAPTWINETFTFNGGSSSLLKIDDDDLNFEDGYVETGTPQVLADPVTINGTTYPANSVVENEFALLDIDGNEVWVVRINGVNIGFTYPSGTDPQPGEEFTAASGRDGAPADSGDGMGSAAPYSAVVCFTPGARIATPGGERAVETLRVGDLVHTVDNGPMPIRWIYKRKLMLTSEARATWPIEIKAGALLDGAPEAPLVVSPQHKFLLRDRGAVPEREVLVPAKALTTLKGVRVMQGKKSVEYVHLALERHEIILAEGTQTESCYLGQHVIDATDPAMRQAMRKVFPRPGTGHKVPARDVLKVREARQMLASGQLGYCAEPADRSCRQGARAAS